MGGEYRIEGGCVCGAVRFELTAPPTEVGYCHCKRCQHRTGTAASIGASVDGRAFRLLSGAGELVCYRPPDGMEKCFCGRCGSHILWREAADHARMGVRMGALDGDPGVGPSYRQFVAYAASWEPIPDDGLPRYPGPRSAGGALGGC